jgi:hypothetical protein
VNIRAQHGGGRMFRKFVTAAVSRPTEMKKFDSAIGPANRGGRYSARNSAVLPQSAHSKVRSSAPGRSGTGARRISEALPPHDGHGIGVM